MANLTETDIWEAGIYQLEQIDPVDAGVAGAGISNLQGIQLANRTGYLKSITDALINNSLSLSGDPPLFDSSQLIATTNWVNNAQSRFKDVLRITGNTTLVAADFGKMLLIDALAATSYTTTFPLLAALPPGASITIKHDELKPMKWQTVGSELFFMNHFNSASPATGDGLNDTFFYTQKGDVIRITRSCANTVLGSSTPYWIVEPLRGSLGIVGRMVSQWTNGAMNALAFEEGLSCLGQLLNRADYPRLWDWVQKVYAGSVPTDAYWSTHQFEFSSGNTTTTFRIPYFAAVSNFYRRINV